MAEAENIYEELQPRAISADEVHALLAALKEENNALRQEMKDLIASKKKEEEGTQGMIGGAPVLHHLHLVDGRVIQNHEGIGTHYSETLEDGTEKITRVREHYPVEEIHPTKAYA